MSDTSDGRDRPDGEAGSSGWLPPPPVPAGVAAAPFVSFASVPVASAPAAQPGGVMLAEAPRLPNATAPQPAIVPYLEIPAPQSGAVPVAPYPSTRTVAEMRAAVERDRRRRARIGTIVAVVGLVVVITGVVFAANAQRRRAAERRFPSVAAPLVESRRVTASDTTTEAGVTTSGTVVLDATSRTLYYDAADDEGADALLVEGRWYFENAGLWFVDESDPQLDAIAAGYFLHADGLTIDEALPPGMRDAAEVRSVERLDLDGRSVRRFDLIMDDDRARRDPGAWSAFTSIWGEPDEIDPSQVPEGATMVGTNLTIWVDDEGVVWRYASHSDFSADGFETTITALSNDAYEYAEPADGSPVLGP
jgi:hypothetical protein